MRSRSLALLVALVLVTAGCARVDLTNEWPAMAEAAAFRPEAGVCTNNFGWISYRYEYRPVPCDDLHDFETVYVGEFKGDAAAGAKPPTGQALFDAAWNDCDTKAAEYFGGQWRLARIKLWITVPSDENWASGARWFRCQAEVFSADASTKSWNKSLKGELATASATMTGNCLLSSGDDGPDLVKDCGEQHNAEFVGTYVSRDTWVAVESGGGHSKCDALVAAYVGVPEGRVGTYYIYPGEEGWSHGDRLIRCYLYSRKGNLAQSLKGLGSKALSLL